MLGNLIDTGKIARFQRSGGWASIGVDPVRTGLRPNSFNGIEKRTAA
jgi:hypothetical protein